MNVIFDTMYKKSTAAVFWSVALEAALLIILACVDINIMSPVAWIEFIYTCFSIHLWIYFLPLAGITVAQGMMYSKKYLTAPGFCKTRFDLLKSFFSFHNMLMLIIFPAMSFTITWTFLSVVGRDYLKMTGSCRNSAQDCVTEGYVFLVLCGIWSGIHFFITNYVWDNNLLVFPVVHQLKYIEVKSELFSSLKLALYKAMWPTLYFLVFFYWKSEYIYDVFDLSVSKSELDILFILHAWLFTTIFIFTNLITRHLLQVYLTEHWEFPVISVLKESVTLHQAIAMKEQPVFQSLGCYDLMVLAGSDFCRRQELFSLSQPGGHPHNWNALIKEVLSLIDNFTSDLNAANLDGGVTLHANKPTPDNLISASPLNVKKLHLHSMRNLSMQRDPVQQDSQFGSAPVPLWDFFTYFVKKRVDQFKAGFSKKPPIRFFFGEIPDARLRYILSQSPQIIWAVQGISCLAATSLREDKYGVVIKDLPSVVLSLVNLKQTLEKIPKTGNYKRSQKNEQDETKIKIALKSAVKRGLYHICLTYGVSVMELELPRNVHSQLQLFLSFKEG
ncbi:nucleoporin Ndc1 [Anabrus simplex]|uniref:nucleoporin Ndc1 n=1 Tax=Anabrus simplex TaxID=316456 RepID=UPI0035A32A79